MSDDDADADAATNDQPASTAGAPERVSLVAQHYSSRPQASRQERAQSRTIGLKSFNNWLKTVLLNLYCRRGDFVLDLASGKGGDLAKWCKLQIGALVMADVASESVKQSLERYIEARTRGQAQFAAHFVDADCSLSDLWTRNDAVKAFTRYGLFDFVSCQFALHYAFETESRARAMLHNAASRLRPGGHFVCTIPNAHLIVKRLRATRGLSYGNQLYRVRVAPPKQVDSFAPFGAEYFFTLLEAVEDCPEYLVHPSVLEALANEYALDLVLHQPFDEFYRLHVDTAGNRDLLQRMRADDISDEEWEAIGFYSVFAFRKRGTPQPHDIAQIPPDATNAALPTVASIVQLRGTS